MLSQAQQIAKDNNINLKQISLKILVPLLEFSSLEDDETLQDKWTNLFVNYIDSNEKYESTIFPFILNQLSSKEVIEIDRIYTINSTSFFNKIEISGITKSNFIRLGLVEVIPENGKLNSFTRHLGGNSNRVRMTALGKEFVKCCSPKNK